MTTSPQTPIAELMSRHIVTVGTEADLKAVWNTLAENKISGAPVVDENGEIQGVISQHDILKCLVTERSERLAERSFYQALPTIAEGFFPSGDRIEDALRLTAREVMNPRIIAVHPNDSVRTVATVLRRNHIHRVIVCDKAKIVGIVSTFDLLAIFEGPNSDR
jgi:CBS domain-containing protein